MVLLKDLTDDQLSIFIGRYRERKLTEGGVFTLAELLREARRRNGTGFNAPKIGTLILNLCQSSSDGFATYGELFERIYPGEKWIGHKSLGLITKALDSVITYCFENNLPVITVLIVNSANRQLTAEAKNNIYTVCRELGFDTGIDCEAFIKNQITRSLQLRNQELPEISN